MVSGGTTLGGRYKLDERIAGGGMGDVWRGTDEVLGRTVAVKILLPALLEEPGFAERFRGEARTMATINHPGVVDVYDYGSDASVGAYLVMEYVEGDALSRTLSRVNRLTPARTMALVAQAADALQAAHEKGIVHRDVKPGNLLVRPNGTLVLTDFGIARSAQVGQLTQAGAVLGTASYISPEQASGAVATPLSDIYALGVVAYQCLSGRRPHEGDNPLEIAMKHVRDQPPPLPADIPPAVRGVVERAMAKDPNARFPSAAAFGQVARHTAAGLGGTTSTAAGSPVPVPPVPAPTSPGPTGTGAVPRPPTAGGTRVMPSYPTAPAQPAGGIPPTGSPVSPGSPAGPSAYHRGAAAVPPPPPPRGETTYLPGQPPSGGPSSGRSTMIILAVLIGVLLLLIGGFVGWQLLHNTGGGATPTSSSTATGTAHASAQPSPTLTGQPVSTFCDEAKGHTFERVRDVLKKDGFKVKREDVPGPRDRVVEVTPCEAPKGATITVRVGNGQPVSGGGAAPGTSTAPDTSTEPGGGLPSGGGPGGGSLCSPPIAGGLCPTATSLPKQN
jgi:serine/threonine-protein kinase